MAILNIVQEGDPVLGKKCKYVQEITPRIIRLLDDMHETLEDADGAGLAAPQVGILKRIAVIFIGEEILDFINPEIIAAEGEQEDIEGCLSVPGVWGITKRPAKVTVRAIDRKGKTFEVTGEGLEARCLCHELDHLDGHLFTERTVRTLSYEEAMEYTREYNEKKEEK
ncbi:MAG: peptide deformylase [Clostridia bacterium]|nr:peptide deformylase [Clostridia bacterium]